MLAALHVYQQLMSKWDSETQSSASCSEIEVYTYTNIEVDNNGTQSPNNNLITKSY